MAYRPTSPNEPTYQGYSPTARGGGVRPGGTGRDGTNDKPADTGNIPVAGTPIQPRAVSQTAPFRQFSWTPTGNEVLPYYMGACKRVPGQLVSLWSTPTGSLLCAWFVTCGPEREYLDSMTIEGKTFANLGITNYNVYLGTSGQTIDPIGTSIRPATWTKRFPNVAYVVAELPEPNTSGVGAPDPFQFLCNIGAPKIFDPRLDVTLATLYFSSNPALNHAYWWYSPKYTTETGEDWSIGPNEFNTPIDTTQVGAAADICDVDLGGGVKRFVIGLPLTDTRDRDQNIEAVRAHYQGLAPVLNAAKWQFPIDWTQASSGIILDDGSGGNPVNLIDVGPLEDLPISGMYTRVTVNHRDDAANSVMRPVTDVDATATVVRDRTVDIPGVPAGQAGRLARYLRKLSLVDKRSAITVNGDGIRLLPGIRVTVWSQILNSGGGEWIITDVSAAQEGEPSNLFHCYIVPYVAALYDDTAVSVTSYVPALNPSPFDTPPNIVNLVISGSSGANASAWWQPAAAVSEVHYGTGNWSASNLGGYNGAKVNDAVTNVKAFDWNVAADSTLTFDAGAGNAKDFRYCIVYDSSGLPSQHLNDAAEKFEYSDNGSSWTALSRLAGAWPAPPAGGNLYAWAGVGSHRYWRFRKGSSVAHAVDFYEVQFGEVTAVSALVEVYEVYDAITGKLYQSFDRSSIPTASAPLTLAPIATTSTDPSTNITTSTVSIKVVTRVGTLRSSGVTGSPSAFTFSAPGSLTLPLANGLNSNVDISSYAIAGNAASIADVGGVTGAFSVGGFFPAYGAKHFVLNNNSGQTMTIIDADGTTTLGRRIRTFVGNFALTSPGVVVFEYSTISNCWIVVSARDGTGAH